VYNGCGVVYKVDSTGHETVLHRFSGYADGGVPTSGVTLDATGNIYGTTYSGGSLAACTYGCGVVYKLDPAGNETVLYNFTGGADGGFPSSGLILDAAGDLYGTTSYGGATGCGQGCGVVYKLDPTGQETVLHSFTPGRDGNFGADGGNPSGHIVRDDRGNLYGTTASGGPQPIHAVVYKLDPAGHETVLYRFTGGADGLNPEGGVVGDAAGNLFGTTYNGGGSAEAGVVYKVDPSGKETVLYTFTGGTDGANPNGVILDPAGNLLGTASGGGRRLGGVVFEIKR